MPVALHDGTACWGIDSVHGQTEYPEDLSDVQLRNDPAKIEKEVKALVEGGLNEARRILTEKKDDWVKLSEGLLEYETLSGQEIVELLKGNPPHRDTDVPPKTDDGTPPSGALPVIDDDEDEASNPGGLEPKPGGA